MVNHSAAADSAAARGALIPHLLLALCAAAALLFSNANATIGVNFGQTADDLPSADVVLQLVQTTSLTKIKIYGTDSAFLTAFAGTGIDIVIGASNDQIEPLANETTSASYALQWVQTNIVAYPNTSIVAVALGNEVLSYSPDLMPLLVPALQNLQAALVSVGLDQKVKLSTPHSLAIVAQSYPPSYGVFHDVHVQVLVPLLDFLSLTGAPFMVNAYPYFAYAGSPQNISLDYVLFNSAAVPVYDDGSSLNYTNMYDAQLDAVYAAISKLGYDNVSLAVSESGWPTAGDATEVGASVENAQLFNANLIKHVISGVGTPARPNVPVETYIFALYNENLKPGPTSERNFGMYLPDGTQIYDAGLTVSPTWTTSPPPPASSIPPPPYTVAPPPPPVVGTYPPPPPAGTAVAPVSYTPPPPPLGYASPPPPVAVAPGVTGIPPPPPSTYASPPPPVTAVQPPPLTIFDSPPPPLTTFDSPPPPLTVYYSPPPPLNVFDSPPPPLTVYYSPPPPLNVFDSPPPPLTVYYSPPPPLNVFDSPPPPAGVLGPVAGVSPPPPPVTDYSPPPPPVLGPVAGVSPPPPPPPTALGPVSGVPPPSPPVGTPTPPPPASVSPYPPASPTTGSSWCVAQANADTAQLQIGIDWACSEGGADCSLIQAGAACFEPDTYVAHASYAYNSYYQLNNRNYWNCFFSDTANITTVDPSYTGCTYT